jgi:hypothetical protein
MTSVGPDTPRKRRCNSAIRRSETSMTLRSSSSANVLAFLLGIFRTPRSARSAKFCNAPSGTLTARCRLCTVIAAVTSRIRSRDGQLIALSEIERFQFRIELFQTRCRGAGRRGAQWLVSSKDACFLTLGQPGKRPNYPKCKFLRPILQLSCAFDSAAPHSLIH